MCSDRFYETVTWLISVKCADDKWKENIFDSLSVLLTTLSSNCYTFCGVATFAGDTWTVDTSAHRGKGAVTWKTPNDTNTAAPPNEDTKGIYRNEKTLEDNKDNKKIHLADTGDKNMQHF